MEMAQMSGVPKLEDDAEAAAAEEPWPPAMREKERQRRRVLLVAGLMALPLLAFLFLGRDSASMVWEIASAKLNSMNQQDHKAGFAHASHGHGHGHGHGHVHGDELLGGLLAPGMDRPSCRSRYELSSYFKRFPYAPSPYLLGKLRAYEALHRRCAPGTPLYAKAVEQLKSGVSGGAGAMECRYVVWLPFDGLGNRMLSMASGFLYALLTGRVLLAAIPPDSADLFCEPFPNTTWLLPAEDFPVANLFWLGASPDVSLTSLLKSNKIAVDVGGGDTPPAASNATAAPPVPAYVYLSLGWQMTDGPFFCGEHQVALGKVDWLLLFSDLYFVPSLYQVAEFQPELRRLFPETKESAAHLLLRYLLRPTNPVWDLVTAYYDANLAPAARRISLQIRMFGFASIAADDYYKQILACSAQEHVLPEPDGGGGNGSSTTTAIFIASLYPDYYKRLTARYAAPNAAAGERVVGVFQRTHEQRQATHNLQHNQRALAEIYLLSFSEELMTSGMSTFGYVSSSLAGVRPAILLPAYNHRVPATPCRRAVSMEPCNLTPPRGVECHGKAVDKEDFERHVKVCEDREVGVKFFD